MKVLVTTCCAVSVIFSLATKSATSVLLPMAGIAQSTVLAQRRLSGFDQAQSSAAPIITALSPSSGFAGALVTIRGANFTSDNNLVLFRGQQKRFGSRVGSEDGVTLRVRVNNCPSDRPVCPGYYIAPGVYAVTVINDNGSSNEAAFSVTPR
jgi:hypothetical protein